MARRPTGKLRSEDTGLNPALYLELTAAMLSAGLSLVLALERLGELEGGRHREYLHTVVLRLKAGGSWGQAWAGEPTPAELVPLKDTLGFMVETGAPSAALLEIMAARERRKGYRTSEKSAAKLGVKLVVPLGLCSLPAFICLGVLPVLISMVPAVLP